MVVAGETCFESYSYANSSDNSEFASMCSTRDMFGIRVVTGSSLIGMAPASVDFKIHVNGTGGSCGTLTARIVADASDGSTTDTAIATSTNSYAVTSVSDNDILSFTFSGTSALAEDNGIYLHATDTNTCMDCWTNYITVTRQTSQTADAAVFMASEWGGSNFEDKNTSDNSTIKICG
jgi:hypothetical protein